MSFDIERDRAELQAIVNHMDTVIDVLGEIYARTRENLSSNFDEQYDAAAADAQQRFLHAAEVNKLVRDGNADQIEGRIGDEARPYLLAAVMRCYEHRHCPHLDLFPKGSAQPVYLYLAARVATCETCIPTFVTDFLASDHRAATGQDMTCDICLEEADQFYETIFTHHVFLFRADTCARCNTMLRPV